MKTGESFISFLLWVTKMRMWHGIAAADFSRIGILRMEIKSLRMSRRKRHEKLAQLVSTFASLTQYFKQILELEKKRQIKRAKRRKIKSDSALCLVLFPPLLLSFWMFCEFFWQAHDDSAEIRWMSPSRGRSHALWTFTMYARRTVRRTHYLVFASTAETRDFHANFILAFSLSRVFINSA